ncbi:phosphomethylpyrimidine synthase ThiC, partial [candidate division WOR-3 bacterium]|nr:phosphomethylpyrimidine synthase ThiC [candidate division WOR-3 bacterium]
MTQLEFAKKGKLTPQIKKVAKEEEVSEEFILESIANGKLVIPCNSKYNLVHPVGIGKGLRTKVNSNIGSSSDCIDYELEKKKARLSEKAGADAIMDLSTGGDISKFRRIIRENFSGPLGTVPIYEAIIEITQKKGGIVFMTPDDIFRVIEKHAKDGVDFVTVHCGVTRS